MLRLSRFVVLPLVLVFGKLAFIAESQVPHGLAQESGARSHPLGHCSVNSYFFLGFAGSAFSAAIVVVAWLCARSQQNTAQIASTINVILFFVRNASTSVIIATAPLLAEHAGFGAFYAGTLMSASMVGLCAGVVLMCLTLQLWPKSWRHAPSILCAATILNTSGAILYSTMLFLAAAGYSLSHLMVLPLLARMLDGLGAGMLTQLWMVSVVKIIPSNERPDWMARDSLANMLGTGLGPMIGAAMGALNTCDAPLAVLPAAGIGYLAITVAGFVIMAGLYPTSFETVADVQDLLPICLKDEDVDEVGLDPEFRRKMAVQVLMIVMVCLRGFTLMGLESATSLMLEVKFDWGTERTGMLLGACFLTCIPLQLLFRCQRSRLSVPGWTRLFMPGVLVGSVLLFKVWAGLGDTGESLMVLIAASMMFPMLALCDVLVAGMSMMAHNIFPQGYMHLSPNMLQLYRQVGQNGLGRCLGAPMANLMLEQSGQNGYAGLLCLCTAAYWLLLELFIQLQKPPTQEHVRTLAAKESVK